MNISRQIVGYLKSRELVLASIETCTAGTLTSSLADWPGASMCLDIGIVAHSTQALAQWPGLAAEFDVVNEASGRKLAEALLAQREARANVALVSLGWFAAEEGSREPVAHVFAWACRNRDAVVSASETVLFSGRRPEVRRSIARRALLGLPRFVDSVLAR
jgi:nicotinamide mononucleotide (NMN) deamidase PncC